MQATAADGRRFGVARPPSAIRRRLSLKERLGGFKGFGCCGATWGLSSQTIVLTDTDTDDNHDHAILTYDHQPIQPLPPPPPQLDDDGIDTFNLIPALQGPQSAAAAAETVSSDGCLLLQPPATPASSSMSLAAALEAERQLRDPYDDDDDDDDNNNGRVTSSGSTANNNSVVGGGLDNDINGRTGSSGQGTPARVSLMRLLEETSEMEEKKQEEKEEEEEEDVKNDDRVCCVCMGRKKGAAFIPCGHTFCRMCSRELWLSRGTCPLCNRCILEILDIF